MAIPISYNVRNLIVRKTTTIMTGLGIAMTVGGAACGSWPGFRVDASVRVERRSAQPARLAQGRQCGADQLIHSAAVSNRKELPGHCERRERPTTRFASRWSPSSICRRRIIRTERTLRLRGITLTGVGMRKVKITLRPLVSTWTAGDHHRTRTCQALSGCSSRPHASFWKRALDRGRRYGWRRKCDR